MREKYVLDTNAVNRLVDQGIDPRSLSSDFDYYITPAQWTEIEKTRDPSRRAELLKVLKQLVPPIASERGLKSLPWGAPFDSRHPWSEWGASGGRYEEINAAIVACKSKSRRGDLADSLLLELCLLESLVLVTNDDCAQEVGSHFRVRWCSFEDFIQHVTASIPRP